MIQKFRQVGRLCLRTMQLRPACMMSDKWKERGETAQNMYISQKEKDILKKLLKRVEDEGDLNLQEQDEFNDKLRGILHRHNIQNEALESEIINLHMRYD